jgi:tetratricopeptide (TPR) repeat protein
LLDNPSKESAEKMEKYEDIIQHIDQAIKENDLEWAEEELQKAIEVSPNDPRLHYNLGLIYYKRGMYKFAKSSFEKAKSINPKNPLYGRAIGSSKRRIRSEKEKKGSLIWKEIVCGARITLRFLTILPHYPVLFILLFTEILFVTILLFLFDFSTLYSTLSFMLLYGLSLSIIGACVCTAALDSSEVFSLHHFIVLKRAYVILVGSLIWPLAWIQVPLFFLHAIQKRRGSLVSHTKNVNLSFFLKYFKNFLFLGYAAAIFEKRSFLEIKKRLLHSLEKNRSGTKTNYRILEMGSIVSLGLIISNSYVLIPYLLQSGTAFHPLLFLALHIYSTTLFIEMCLGGVIYLYNKKMVKTAYLPSHPVQMPSLLREFSDILF